MKLINKINHWDRCVYVDCKEAFLDAQAEIEAEDEGVGFPTEVDGGSGYLPDTNVVKNAVGIIMRAS